MEDKQYYTPEIEDISVGYECEINKSLLPGISEGWHKYKFETESQIGNIIHHSLVLFRTPFFTTEDLEKEGWTPLESSYKHPSEDKYSAWEKGNYFLVLRDNNMSVIVKDPARDEFTLVSGVSVRYSGKKPSSINEFRKLSKWLGI